MDFLKHFIEFISPAIFILTQSDFYFWMTACQVYFSSSYLFLESGLRLWVTAEYV